MVRGFVLLAGLLAVEPALAGEMRGEDARRFVAGKLFAYNCFEGTRGTGRINADGSAIGSIQFRGAGPVRYAALPAGTLRVKGNAVCASLKGMPMEPCFYLQQTSAHSFRGTVYGLSFAYCDFIHRGGRAELAGTPQQAQQSQQSHQPLRLQSAASRQ